MAVEKIAKSSSTVESTPKEFSAGFKPEEAIKRLESKQAICVIDGRESEEANPELLNTLRDRINLPNHQEILNEFMKSTGIDEEKLNQYQGKTFVVTYTKYGHGHKHQALDIAASIALALKARVILFDPMDSLPDRENMLMYAVKSYHAALQKNQPELIEETADKIRQHPLPKKLPYRLSDMATNNVAIFLGEMVKNILPAQEATGNDSLKSSGILNKITEKLQSSPKIYGGVIRVFNQLLIELTERSTACATAGIAAHYEAEAIITTHPNTIRSLSLDTLPWLPKELRPRAKHALKTILMLIPDPGYTFRDQDADKEINVSPQDRTDAMLLNAFFIVPNVKRKLASWLKSAISITHDSIVSQALVDNWGTPKDTILELGTSSHTISAEQFKEKWSKPYRAILFAANGNGSNALDFQQALKDLETLSYPPSLYLETHNVHLDLYLADHHLKPGNEKLLEEIYQSFLEAGITPDQIQTIDHTQSFAEGKSPEYDPNKLVHIGFAQGDAASSDLKQWMQIQAHAEIRSPGENAITGAAVGTVQLCTPPGGANEIYNMIVTARNKLAQAINWPSKTPVWDNPEFGINISTLIEDSSNFAFILQHIINPKDDAQVLQTLAEEGFNHVNKFANPTIVTLLLNQLFKRDDLNQALSTKKINEKLTELAKEANQKQTI